MRNLLCIPLLLALAGCASQMSAPLVPLEGAPSDSLVAASLEHAVTMDSVLHLYPWALRQWPANLDLVEDLQPSLVGRAALVWGWEHLMLRSLNGLERRVSAIHQRAPDAVVQGCIFEFISRDVERVQVPAHVLEAFGQPPVPRAYVFEDMLPTDREIDWFNGWQHNAAVPDITRLESRMWFFHLASLYIDSGLEAIHLGNLGRVAAGDVGLSVTREVLDDIRAYAAQHARRGWVLLDAHTHGLKTSGRLLLDFHSFPLRPREVGDADLSDVVLEEGFQDAIYGRSLGGVTPAGVLVASQRFLVELDNGYAGPSAGGCDLPECVWGSDEISWFASRPDDQRDQLLRYFWRRVPELDAAGRFQFPCVRPVQAILDLGCARYLAHGAGEVSCGRGQAAVIAELWWGAP